MLFLFNLFYLAFIILFNPNLNVFITWPIKEYKKLTIHKSKYKMMRISCASSIMLIRSSNLDLKSHVLKIMCNLKNDAQTATQITYFDWNTFFLLDKFNKLKEMNPTSIIVSNPSCRFGVFCAKTCTLPNRKLKRPNSTMKYSAPLKLFFDLS